MRVRTRGRGVASVIAVVCSLSLLAGACGFSQSHLASKATPTTVAESPDPTTSTGPTTTADLSKVPPGPNGFTGRLTPWHACRKPVDSNHHTVSFECATLSVPLDWANPAGPKLPLAVIRQRAIGPGPRIGSLLLNPGGPGAAGTDFLFDLVDGQRVPKGLDEQFDLVSWDPRGTGASGGIECTTVAELQAPDIDPTPDNAQEAAAITAQAQHRAAECQKAAGDRLALVGTRNTVRDLDALRYALGDPRLSYVGYSYGTTIGMEYARMFPSHLRAMVLDGVAIPGTDEVTESHDQAKSFEANLDAFLADCKQRGSDCTFGNGDPEGALKALISRLEQGTRIPASYRATLQLERTATVGIGELSTALAQAMYDKDLWPVLEQGLAQATDPDQPDGGQLLLLRDLYEGRNEDGTWTSIQDAFGAISCADVAERPANATGDPALRTAWSKELPLLGAFFAAGTPGCYLAPPAREPLTLPAAGSITGIPPVVIIGGIKDPATPYAAALQAHRIIPDSVVLTWLHPEHTAYGRGSACLDDPVTKYLVTVQLPKAGIRCPAGG